jgi:hypothetical protein
MFCPEIGRYISTIFGKMPSPQTPDFTGLGGLFLFLLEKEKSL